MCMDVLQLNVLLTDFSRDASRYIRDRMVREATTYTLVRPDPTDNLIRFYRMPTS